MKLKKFIISFLFLMLTFASGADEKASVNQDNEFSFYTDSMFLSHISKETICQITIM